MRLTCVMCGRPTEPFVMIGQSAIGPKCAKRAGMTPAKLPKTTRLKFVRPSKAPRQAMPTTRDLFEEEGQGAA